MPMLDGSTMVPPPYCLNRLASSMARSTSSRPDTASTRPKWYFRYASDSSVTGWLYRLRALASAGRSTMWSVDTSRWSWVNVTPSSPGSTSPSTVCTLPSMLNPAIVCLL